jgi:SAM-dependent methyltransferase
MPEFKQTDWYRFPKYYDIIFDPDTETQADFLESVIERHGPAGLSTSARILEPACGSGRLIIALARRGHRATGFDASPEMIAYARHRASAQPASIRRKIKLHESWMQSFRLRGPFDLANCLLSTFKYLLTEEHAHAHLKRIARVLAPGGLYVIGLHLTDYHRRTNETETWREEDGAVRVTCQTITRPPDTKKRVEALRNRLHVKHAGIRKPENLETNWLCRTYDLPQLKSLLSRVPELKLVACYDFNHDINTPRDLDTTDGDPVIVLQKCPEI